MEKFVPRTFNMGFSKEVYDRVGGFKDMFGEDIDLSTRIAEAGYTISLLRDVYVFHKRRVSWKSFYRQVNVFGMARIDLYLLYPHSLKLVHCFPALFVIGSLTLLFSAWITSWTLLPLIVYICAIAGGAWVKNKSVSVAVLAVFAAFIQLFGYGCGFLKAFWNKVVMRKNVDKEQELERHYKKR